MNIEEAFTLAGVQNAMPATQRRIAEAARGIMAHNSSSHKYFQHFLQRMHELPENIVELIANQRMQIVDGIFYKTANFVGQSLDVFQEDDTIQVGVCNVAKSRLDPERPFVLSAIALQYATHATDAIANFEPVEYAPALKRGEFQLRYDSKDILDKMPVLGTFDPGLDGYNINHKYGVYELVNPKLFLGDKRIEFSLRLPAGQTLGANAHAVKFFGIGTTLKAY